MLRNLPSVYFQQHGIKVTKLGRKKGEIMRGEKNLKMLAKNILKFSLIQERILNFIQVFYYTATCQCIRRYSVVLYCGIILWYCIVALYCGIVLWYYIVVLYFGIVLWYCIVVLYCGILLVSTNYFL
jgi:hypothetical protein